MRWGTRAGHSIQTSNGRSDALKGHCLTVAHNGAYKAGDILPHLNANDSIQLVFIGEMDKWNRVRKNWKESGTIVSAIQIRPRVIQQWLQVLLIVNPYLAGALCRGWE